MQIDVWELFFGFLFGVVGLAYLKYGKKQADLHFIVSGLLLMGFVYFVDSRVWTVADGALLSAYPFVARRFF